MKSSLLPRRVHATYLVSVVLGLCLAVSIVCGANDDDARRQQAAAAAAAQARQADQQRQQAAAARQAADRERVNRIESHHALTYREASVNINRHVLRCGDLSGVASYFPFCLEGHIVNRIDG